MAIPPVNTRDVVRTRVPLRISFGGGGTDVEPYVSRHGGVTLNATIARYVYASVHPNPDGQLAIEVTNWNRVSRAGAEVAEGGDVSSDVALVEAVVARINPRWKRGLVIRLHSDSPPGSGLGSSSAIVVACIMSVARFMGVVLDPRQVAELAYRVERLDLAVSGGLQDQYAAAYGGFNWTEYHRDRVSVHPLNLRPSVIQELELRLMLWHTGDTHRSGGILQNQVRAYEAEDQPTLARLHRMKRTAEDMRSALERGDLDRFGRLLDRSWQDKRNLAPGISNPRIETLYASARAAGALGGKVIGAGGGGYLLFYVSEEQRARVIQALNEVGGTYGGSVYFDLGGPKTWTSDAFRGEVADFILGS